MIRKLMMAGSALLLATALPAQDTVRTECVQFARNRPAAVYMGSVRGNSTIVYVVSARAGETMNISLITTHPSNYFSVFAPGADSALFDGTTTDRGFSAQVPVTGDYQIKVFLAGTPRPDASAAFSLTIRVANTYAQTESHR